MRGDEIKVAVYAGLIAGLIFMALEMILVPIAFGGSAWGPPRMIAAMILGREVLPPPASFDAGVFIVAMLVHLALSIMYTVLLALFVLRSSIGAATLVGIILGLVLYVANFYLFTEIWPWFSAARNWVTIITHLVFGGVAGYAFKTLQVRYTRCQNC